MNAKTYGQILTEETVKRINYRMTSDGYDKAQEEIARAVILEAFRRVEFKASELVASGDFEDPPYTYSVTTAEAFDMLHTELKEAK